MKIAFCDNSLKELINFRGEIINHYLDKGENIVLIAPKNTTTDNIDPLITVYNSKLKRGGMNPVKDIIYLVQLIRIYLKEKPDIIFHYTIKPNIYGSIAAKIIGIPSVTMIAGLGYAFNHNDLKSWIARKLYKFSMRFPKKIILLNIENMNCLVEHKIIRPQKCILLLGGEGINLMKYK